MRVIQTQTTTMSDSSRAPNRHAIQLPDSPEELIRIVRTPPVGHGEELLWANSMRAAAASELGMRGDPKAVPALMEALSDHNYVCTVASLALARIRPPEAIDALVTILADSKRFWVPRGAAAVALGRFGSAAHSALPALRKALKYKCRSRNETWDWRAQAAVKDAIQHITEPEAPCSLENKGYLFEMWGIY